MSPTDRNAGLFVVLEGIDGAGTSSQARRLQERLGDKGVKVHLTCEPSTGPIGRLLRECLSGEHKPVDEITMGLLFAADRADHLAREIAPKLKNDELVISDRYYHSSLAYQGSAESRSWVATINGRATAPDCTYFLRVDPGVAARRRASDDLRGEDEIYEGSDTQKRVAEAYDEVMAELAKKERICVVDGHKEMDAISDELVDDIYTLWQARPSS